MKKSKVWENVGSAVWLACSVAIIPVILWVLRPRPLVADSAPALVLLARENSAIREETADALRLRNATNVSLADPRLRWQELEAEMVHRGAEPYEAKGILRAARVHTGNEWACFARRGYVNQTPVWLIGTSPRREPGLLGFCGFTTAEERRKSEENDYNLGLKIAVVGAEPPYAPLT